MISKETTSGRESERKSLAFTRTLPVRRVGGDFFLDQPNHLRRLVAMAHHWLAQNHIAPRENWPAIESLLAPIKIGRDCGISDTLEVPDSLTHRANKVVALFVLTRAPPGVRLAKQRSAFSSVPLETASLDDHNLVHAELS